MKVALPENLNGKEYEEAVSSFIRAQGYFVENRIILDHNGIEILELDTVATPITDDYSDRILIDAKSGKRTGFSDIFKIYGWKQFLNISKGCIIRKNPPNEKDIEALENYSHVLNVSWESFNINKDENTLFDIDKTFPETISRTRETFFTMFFSGWWGAISERVAYKNYKNFIKTCDDEDLVYKLRKYEKVCMLSFFEKDPIKRVIELYDAFKRNPNISNDCINYIIKKNWKNKIYRSRHAF